MSGVYYNEIDPFCVAWLHNLMLAGEIPWGEVDARSIEDVKPDDLKGFHQCHFFAGIGLWALALERAGWGDRPVWTGSCPCQPFSAAGKGLGFDDERHLWPAWQWHIEQCRPPTIFGEQVSGPAGGAWLDLVLSDLEGMGYACGAAPFPAASIVAPQGRHRIYWVADSSESRSLPTAHRGLHRVEESPRARDAKSERHGDAGELARADGQDQSGPGVQRPREGAGASPRPTLERSSGLCATGDLGGAERERLALGSIATEFGRPLRIEGAAFGATEPVRGFWAGADWIWHRDGKYRPVEPGTFPLVAGHPGRVGQLRAYGNSIVVEAAKAFIEAYLAT